MEGVTTMGGAQGCKRCIDQTNGASPYGSLVTRALLRMKTSDLSQMFFIALKGKAEFTT